MAARSRCQALRLGDRDGSFMAVLPEAPCLVEPGEQPAEQVAELLPSVGGEACPEPRARVRVRRRWGGQARGGAVGRAAVGMWSLRVVDSGILGTARPAQAARRQRS